MEILRFLRETMRRARAVALGACMMAAGEAFAAGPDDTDSEKRETWKIEGTVTDKNSEPIVGAAILERGTTNGTVTDTLGRFRLEFDCAACFMKIRTLA